MTCLYTKNQSEPSEPSLQHPSQCQNPHENGVHTVGNMAGGNVLHGLHIAGGFRPQVDHQFLCQLAAM